MIADDHGKKRIQVTGCTEFRSLQKRRSQALQHLGLARAAIDGGPNFGKFARSEERSTPVKIYTKLDAGKRLRLRAGQKTEVKSKEAASVFTFIEFYFGTNFRRIIANFTNFRTKALFDAVSNVFQKDETVFIELNPL